MKYHIMIGILLTLLDRRKVSAGDLAAKYGVSVRSVYRYIDEMTCAGIPIDVARGSNGGIYISDAYKLTRGLMSKEEYARTIESMLAMKEQTGDPVLESAIHKLSAHVKSERVDFALSGNIFVDSGTWGDARKFSELLALLERAIEECEALQIDYVDREGEASQRKILPHLLIYKQNIWYLYAYCCMRQGFRTFKLGRIRTVLKTGEVFEKLPFSREDIPLNFWPDGEHRIDAKFEITAESLPFAQDWLGVENVYTKDGRHYADVSLPNDESLIYVILQAGAGFKVLSPASLAERVKKEAERIAASYQE